MMTDVNRLVNPISHSLSALFKQGSRIAGELAGRVVNQIQLLPGQMQQDRRVAIAVFLVSNAVFFSLALVLAKNLDKQIEKHPEELSDDQQAAKHVLLSAAVGGSVFVLNHLLAQATRTPLSHGLIGAMSTIAIIAQMFSSLIANDPLEEKNPKAEEEGAKEDLLKKLQDEHQIELEKINQAHALAITTLQSEHQVILSDLNAEIKFLNAEKDEQAKILEAAQEKIAKLESTLSKLKMKSGAETKEKEEEAQETIKTLEAEVEKLKAFVKERMETHLQEKKELQDQITQLNQENANLKKPIPSSSTKKSGRKK